MDKPVKPVHLCFETQCIEVSLSMLQGSKTLQSTFKQGMKYQQIRLSVKAIGLVEPIVVIPFAEQPGAFTILDGHLRVEALKDLGIEQALCLIAKDDEGFTYNRSVSSLSAVQQHRMIMKVNKDGVTAERLAEALGISVQTILGRFRLLNGICDEAIILLADKHVPHGLFRFLRKMKAFRQIDVAKTMISMNNYSIKLGTAMLHNTPADQLVDSAKEKANNGNATEALQRMQREVVSMEADTKLLDDSYGPANLQLTIIKTYIKSILDKVRIVRWLSKHEREYLEQLEIIAEIKPSSSG